MKAFLLRFLSFLSRFLGALVMRKFVKQKDRTSLKRKIKRDKYYKEVIEYDNKSDSISKDAE